MPKTAVSIESWTDSNNHGPVTQATLMAGEDIAANRMLVEARNSYNTISTATTTAIKSASGFLHTITITGGTAGTIIVYDNTAASGTQIANFDSTAEMKTYIFDVSFGTGLTIITSAATKLTVSYR